MVFKLSLVILLHDSKNNIRTLDSHATGRKHTHVSEAVSDADRVGSVRRRGVKVEGRRQKNKTEKLSSPPAFTSPRTPSGRLVQGCAFRCVVPRPACLEQHVPYNSIKQQQQLCRCGRASSVTWREEHKLTNQEARRRRYQTLDLSLGCRRGAVRLPAL